MLPDSVPGLPSSALFPGDLTSPLALSTTHMHTIPHSQSTSTFSVSSQTLISNDLFQHLGFGDSQGYQT